MYPTKFEFLYYIHLKELDDDQHFSVVIKRSHWGFAVVNYAKTSRRGPLKEPNFVHHITCADILLRSIGKDLQYLPYNFFAVSLLDFLLHLSK